VSPPRRLLEWLVNRVPNRLLLNPFEMFLGILCVLSGLPILAGVTPKPGSLDALLPSPVVYGWSVLLVIGGVLVVAGVGRARWQSAELGGLTLLANAAIVYALAITVVLGTAGLVAAAIVAAFGLACIARIAVIVNYRRVVRREAEQLG
jgi:hypothetical protein